MTILSFNTALLDYKIMGLRLLRPTNYIQNRVEALSDKLLALSADVICLQEIYGQPHKKILIDRLKSVYPFCCHYAQKYLLSLDNGLMIFSKWPLVHTYFERFRQQPFEEKILSKKALLGVVVAYQQHLICITNTHTTASGWAFKQNSNRVEKYRKAQIEQTFNKTAAIKKAKNCALSFVCGDFNCGPQVAASNYAQALAHNLVDLYTEVNDAEQPTWDTDNVLNQESPIFKSSPKQRIDFIFGDTNYRTIFKRLKTSIVFKETYIPITPIKSVPLSDHYGVFAELT